MKKKDIFTIPKAQIETEEYIKERINWLNKQLKINLSYISPSLQDIEIFKGLIENFVGYVKIPLGIAGPLKVNGEFAQGFFFVPFATTQSTLIRSYDRGMFILTKSGGANVSILKDEIHITPVFWTENLLQAKKFIIWIERNFDKIKREAEKTTKHGKLLKIKPWIIGRKVFLSFYYSTMDAMGLNIIVIATDSACKYISKKTGIKKYYLRSNLSSDKKVSFLNFIEGYGKDIVVETKIPKEIIQDYFNVTPQEIYDFWHSAVLGSIQAGMVGINAHFANGLAAIFTACGQDVASIINAYVGIGECEITPEGDLYTSLRVPCLPIGTVGGATFLPWQRECLKILGCEGEGKAKKFAEIIGATLLSGEISIIGSFASKKFAEAHITARKRKAK
jgi:hydroxymethylglutaryl-CoA reductase (NADPH)